MSNTYYTSLSGMLAASYGLQNTSNNIANMQSPGFKRSDVFYSSLGNGNGNEGLGMGVCVKGSTINFNDGKYLETNSPSDLAIVGQGFFVIRTKSGELMYTRDGEFTFDSKGFLVDKHSKGQVQGYNVAGQLVPIHEKGPKTCPGKPTRDLFINGQFILVEKSDEDKNQPGPFKNKFENIVFTVAKVYDAQGKAHQLRFEFQSTPVLVNGDSTDIPDDGKSWDLVNITCDDATIQFKLDQRIQFSSLNVGADPDFSSIQFTMDQQKPIWLRFGSYMDGSDNSVQLKDYKETREQTVIDVWENDGYGQGTQIGYAFDENGQIAYQYDNGQSIQGIHVGLAKFDDLEHSLSRTQDNLFRSHPSANIQYGRANEKGFGSVQSKQLESSNVDSTTEFANIVVLQRMFQACSQLMDIEKKLLDDLER